MRVTSSLQHPEFFESEEQLEQFMSRPSPELVEYMACLKGDLAILGIAGKIGLTLGRAAKRAADQAGFKRRIIGISRFSTPGVQERLESLGVETITCDLLDPEQITALPKVENVVFMAGKKFGTTGAEESTWALNTAVPANVARHYRESRIVVFSTGCVYNLVPVKSGGAVETTPLQPQGEYANSTVGRERVFLYFGKKYHTPICLLRLNYAIDLRYGVLREIGEKVFSGLPVDITMGHVNVIWQGDVINQALLAFSCCRVPARPINIAGPETASVAYIARLFGSFMGKEVHLTGGESETALLNNAGEAAAIFGYPKVPLNTMIRWTARWIESGGVSLNKPTHFEVRDGSY